MTDSGTGKTHWTRVADLWIAWARASGHDAFWAYQRSLAAFIGTGIGNALEIGCGEGRVSRAMKKLGYHVTATDVVPAMVVAAHHANSAHAYAAADGSALPFGDGRFDLVMAYNVLMDLEDIGATLKEARRVMKPDGLFIVSLVHPFSDRGRFAGETVDAPFVIAGTYYGCTRFEVEQTRGSLRMHFAGWSRPLEHYVAAMAEAGFTITSLREPIPDETNGIGLQQWARVPLFLWLKARILD